MTQALCKICRDPGACCRGFVLQGVRVKAGGMTEDAQKALARRMPGAPFEPKQPIRAGSPDQLELWTWSCPKLTEGGRCSIYEDRPDVCRRYVPGSSGLCSMAGVVLTPAERAELGPDAPSLTLLDKLVQTLRGDPNAADRNEDDEP